MVSHCPSFRRSIRGVRSVFLCSYGLLLPFQSCSGEIISSDICIYGGTASGVAAVIQAKRMNKTAIIAEPGNHLGGMTSGGLGATDIGNKQAIGGIAREFYRRVAQHYAGEDAWRFERPQDYFKVETGRDAVAELKL